MIYVGIGRCTLMPKKHDKLGTVADQYLEQRGPSILEHAFEILCESITVGCVYKGLKQMMEGC